MINKKSESENISEFLVSIESKDGIQKADIMQKPQPGAPLFLTNTPSMICDQVLWLVRHSGLNFELRGTPYSLNLKIKKRFAQQWNQDDDDDEKIKKVRTNEPSLTENPPAIDDTSTDNLLKTESVGSETSNNLFDKEIVKPTGLIETNDEVARDVTEEQGVEEYY